MMKHFPTFKWSILNQSMTYYISFCSELKGLSYAAVYPILSFNTLTQRFKQAQIFFYHCGQFHIKWQYTKKKKKKCSSQFQNFIHRIILHPVGHNICKNPMKTLKIVGVTPLHWKSLKVVICVVKTMKFQFSTFDYRIVSNKFQTYRCFYLMDKNRRRRDTFECHFLFHVIWTKKMSKEHLLLLRASARTLTGLDPRIQDLCS